MAINDHVLRAAALALSNAAKGENIYLPLAKAQRLVEPALETAMDLLANRSGGWRFERSSLAVRDASGVRRTDTTKT